MQAHQNGEGSTASDTKDTTTDATDTLVDDAIDEAIKNETEKLYEEACSNISSSGPGLSILTCLLAFLISVQFNVV